MKKIIILFAALISIVFTSCEIDNFEAPEAILSGTVTYNGNPVGVRTNGTQFELWQDGYALREKIAVHIAHDGTYSARLFNGEYKLVKLAGAPWDAESSDTTIIKVSGDTKKDIEVEPYFIVGDATIQQIGNVIQAEFTVDQIDLTASLDNVKLYLSKNILVDENQKDLAVSADISSIILGEKSTIIAALTEDLLQAGYLFARVGVRAKQSNEYYYTQSQMLDIDGDVPINPTSEFTVQTNGLTVSFTNNSTHGVSYAWDFGDGNTSADENPTHTFADEGEYTVTLTVTGEEGTLPATSSQTIAVGYVEIAVENGDMELPGTGRPKDWAEVPGWSADTETVDSGTEAGAWWMPAEDNDYAGVLFTGDPAAYNLTDHVITAGQTFKVNLKGIDVWNGPKINVALYYDSGNGTRNIIDSSTFNVVGGSWTGIELIVVAPAEAEGAKIGIQVNNTSGDGGDGWSGFDDVQLFVK